MNMQSRKLPRYQHQNNERNLELNTP